MVRLAVVTSLAILLCVGAALLWPTLYLHFRGSVRHRLRRQLLDYSVLLAPYNAWVCARSALPATPFHDPAVVPGLDVLRQQWRSIRDEALALVEAGAIRVAERQDDLVFYSFCKRGWRRFYLTWYGRVPDSARAACPCTVALLESLPRVHGAMFAVIPPGARLGKHRDPFGGCLRYHLGLSTPNSAGCWMQVDGRERIWRDGEDVVFDPMYIHKAVNRTEQPRIVLFVDVERPLRGPVSTWINRLLIRRVVGRLTTTGNADGDYVSPLNRCFARMQPLRRALQATKRASPPLYYGLKLTAAVASVVGLVLLLSW